MKKTMLPLIAIVLLSFLLAGCGKAVMQGIIVDINGNSVWFANGLSLERYEEVRELLFPIIEEAEEDSVVMQYVADSVDNFELIDLVYGNADEFEIGDEVNVWLKEDIDQSSTVQAEAKKYHL